MKLITTLDEIEARNDAIRCLLAEALRSMSKTKAEVVAAAVDYQIRKIGEFEQHWKGMIAPTLPEEDGLNTAQQRMPSGLKGLRASAREIESLANAIIDGHEEGDQFIGSAMQIAVTQAEYIRDIRDLLGGI